VAERGGNASWDVFLTYASPDRARARELYDALVALGLNVCFDQAVLQGGDDWYRLLPRYLRASKVVVALVSEASQDAHFEDAEMIDAIEMVRREGGRLIPVRLVPDIELPYGTQQLHALDLFDEDDVATVAGQIAATAPRAAALPDSGPVRSDRIPRPPRYFGGRDELLDRLATQVQESGRTVVLTAVHGMGGVGKTSLAAAYVEAHRADVDIQWWLRSEDPSLLVADLAELAPHLGLPTAGGPDEVATAVRRALEATDRRWLLVFDNAPDERSIAPWIPRRGNGSVLVTSRSPGFTDADKVLQVDLLPRAAAEDFLRRRLATSNQAAAEEEELGPVLDRLGGLPLALEQAAAWVAQVPNRRYDQFVVLYDDAATDPFPDDTRPTGYHRTATTTWRVSIAAVTAAAPLAARILALLAFLAPEPLPCEWLRAIASDRYFAATRRWLRWLRRRQPADVAAIQDALDALHRYSLATISPDDTIAVHRVIQSVTRPTAPPGAIDAAIRLLRKHSPGNAWEVGNWPLMARLTPHALAVDEHTPDAGRATAADLWWILNDAARFQEWTGRVHDAVTTAERAYDVALRRFGPNQHPTLASRDSLGIAYQRVGDYERAISLHEACRSGRQRLLGSNHPITLTSYNNLAVAYRESGDHEHAVRLLEANLTSSERVLGPEHRDTLTRRNNLATAYHGAGDPERAIQLLQANLPDLERILGSEHPYALTSRNNLALAYQDAGDPDRALPLFEAALAGRERILGPDHPDTIQSRSDLDEARRKVEESSGGGGSCGDE
jgi:tetratricopeptide (TPR) repeat protein